MLDMRKKDIFLRFTLRLSTNVDSYFRNYKKVQNVMAELGGMFKTLMILAMLFS